MYQANGTFIHIKTLTIIHILHPFTLPERDMVGTSLGHMYPNKVPLRCIEGSRLVWGGWCVLS